MVAVTSNDDDAGSDGPAKFRGLRQLVIIIIAIVAK
jgi:hypothetical protein